MSSSQDPNSVFSDDKILVAKIAARDQTALSDLYDRYARVMLGLSFKVLGSVEEAEEVVLDVFAQVWRTAARYDPQRAGVPAWLFMLARSRALDRLRSLQRTTRASRAAEEIAVIYPSPLVNDPAENLLVSERRIQIQRALRQLPDDQRQVLELAYFKGLTQAEIAAQMGKPIGTIKTRIRLGLTKLRDTLNTDSSGETPPSR